MKKFSIIALILVLTVSFCACGRKNKEPITTTPPVATPAPTNPESFDNTPNMETNIPDPEVNPNSTMPGDVPTDPGSEPQNGIGNENDMNDQMQDPNENTRNRMRKMK